MLQACLNGRLSKDDHPAVPITPDELARDAAAVRAAGADELHIHPRDESGEESLHPDVMDTTLAAIAREAPGMAVGVSTGAWIAPGGRARHAHIAAWRTVPDYASVNVNEEDFVEVTSLLRGKGVRIEIGLWTTRDVERFVASGVAADCARILVEITIPEPEAALSEAEASLTMLAKADCGLPILLHGEGSSFWPCFEMAGRRGLSARVGLEDGLTLPDGTIAPDNRGLVAAAATILAASATTRDRA